jgi:hypothetical protein
MFMVVQEAYRQVEMDKDPAAKKRRKQAMSYEEEKPERPFKSRRKENARTFAEDFHAHGDDWKQDSYLRKFRWSHIRAGTEMMPMHDKMVDRHGIKNLGAEEAKFFDTVKIPFPMVLIFGTLLVAYFSMLFVLDQEDNLKRVT